MKYFFKHITNALALACLGTGFLHGQSFKYSIPGLDTLERNFIVGGGSSSVLKNGQAEVIMNNSLVSYQLAIHENGDNSPILDRLRNSQFTADFYGFYGVSFSGRFDLGINLKYVRTRLDNAATNSMFKLFEGKTAEEDPFFNPTGVVDRNFGGLATAGIRFRLKPSLKRPEWVVNGGYAISTVKDETAQRQLAADRNVADLGFTYYKGISRNTFYFFGASAMAYFKSAVNDENLFASNANFFLIQRSNNGKLTFYPGLSYGISFKPSVFDDKALIKVVDYLFAYGGVQYAFSSKYNVFVTGGFPLLIDLTNPQQEIVRKSYSILALGFRAGL